MNNATVEHDGVIVEILAGLIRVQVLSQSACSSCHAKGVCNASEMENKIIDVRSDALGYSVGDKVELSIHSQQGFIALLFAYLLPFVILMLTLIIFLAFCNELIAGLASLVVLLPYYAVLYFFRNNLERKFNYMLKRLS